MKQVLLRSGEVTVAEVPAPECPPGGLLVQVEHSLISTGTEAMSIASGGKPQPLIVKALKNPHLVRKVLQKAASIGVRETLSLVKSRTHSYQPTGYSAAGVVLAVAPGVTGFVAGDRVACAGAGVANHAEVVAVPENLAVRVPDGLPTDQAAFVTLGAIAVQGVRRAEVQFGETVVVIGLGLIGLLTVQILKAAGCKVLGADVLPGRIDLARGLGMDDGVVIGSGADLATVARNLTGGHGADAAILTAATPASTPTHLAMECCRERGRVVVVGDVGMALRREAMYKKELDFVISRSYGPGRYDQRYEEKGHDYPYGFVRWTENRNMQAFLALVAEGRVQVAPLITARYRVDEAPAAYRRIGEDRRSVIGVLLEYPGAAAAAAGRRVELAARVSTPGQAQFAIIGAGAFATSVHLPNLRRLGAGLRAVVSRTAHNARQVGEQYGAAYCTTDYDEVLKDPQVSAVIIATRHNLRRGLIEAATQAGKHVFVEKPLAITLADAAAIEATVAASGILLTVGFNRRYAPLAQELKRNLVAAPGPKLILYRVNAGALPPDHWTYDPEEGGGRIRGEGCHFFDLCNWLLDEEPVAVTAQHATGTGTALVDRDNMAVTVRYRGGSLATVYYACTGNSATGKERVELYAGGKSAILEDFRELTLAGFPGKSTSLKAIDKGHAQLLANFVAAVQGKGNLGITVADGRRAQAVAEAALQAAASGREVSIT